MTMPIDPVTRRPYAEPGPVASALRLTNAVHAEQSCARGEHAWTPWLELPDGSFVTVCGRDCGAVTRYGH